MFNKLKNATEAELRNFEIPRFKNIDELKEFISTLETRTHNYGTCVYAMSLAAEAAYNYIASKLGVTGFQASIADLDFLRKTRGMKNGFKILNYSDLLYPQYIYKFTSFAISKDNAEKLSEVAAKELEGAKEGVHPEVIKHWENIAAGKFPEGITIEGGTK
jgi:hypothetical protein